MKKPLKNVKVEEIEGTYNKCIIWFFAFPGNKTGLNELSKLIKSSKTATKKAVESLINQQFLFREVAGRAWILSANQKHPYFLTKKVPYNIDKIYESGVIEAVYKAVPQARTIILFGSYRYGSDTEESDIDIAVEILGDEKIKIERLGIVGTLGYRKNVPVNIHIFSRNKIDLNLFANIANGFILDGFLEVRP